MENIETEHVVCVTTRNKFDGLRGEKEVGNMIKSDENQNEVIEIIDEENTLEEKLHNVDKKISPPPTPKP